MSGTPDQGISHSDFVKKVARQVFENARTKGDGIIPPITVMRLTLMTVSPEYTLELIDQVEASLQTTKAQTPNTTS